jgi:hypothetical protein
LSAPADAGGVRVSFELVVTAQTGNGFVRLGLPTQAHAQLGRVIGT